MEKGKTSSATLLKFIIFSIIGIFLFFINVNIGGASKVPLIHIIDNLKKLIGLPVIRVLVMIICLGVFVTSLWARSKKAPAGLKEYYKKANWFNYFSYTTAAIFSVMVVFNIGPSFILDPVVGASSVKIAGDVLFASVVSGFLVTALLEFGLLEYLGTIMEPIMRVVFRLPGKSSIDALSSFVCSPAVGVMITSGLYRKKVYSAKEAVAITTSFSFVSLGAFAFLSGLAGCAEYYSQIILCSLVLAFVVAAIMVRIPPISRKKDEYIDGTPQTPEERKSRPYSAQLFKDAYAAAIEKAESGSVKLFGSGLASAALFAFKVVAYVVSLSVICLVLANYTPVISWLGVPMVPILNLLGIPDAALIAPSTLAAFVAMSLPSTLLSGTGVSAAAGFFIVVLSTCQIIFFTESANAMLDSDIPVNFLDLVIIFLERTIVLLPLVALATHLIFGF